MLDYLPAEVESRQRLEDSLREIFSTWGYKEVRSPTIEFLDALSVGVGSELVDSMFKFQDFDGKIVALRPEMTAPVARLVVTNMIAMPEPIRLFYISNVFRHTQFSIGRAREFWQGGVELIGSSSPDADSEVLALLIGALRKLGLRDVRVDVNHAGLTKELVKASRLNENEQNILWDLLAYRDWQRFEKFVKEKDIPSALANLFLELMNCRQLNDVSSLSSKLSEFGKAGSYATNLMAILEGLSDYGVGERFFFDFSLTRRIEYYTGVVFEASTPEFGLPIGGGGRYDDLIGEFANRKIPATGFAIEIERCLEALLAQGSQLTQKSVRKVLVVSNFRSASVKTANMIRDAGVVTLLDLAGDEEKAIEYAQLTGIDYVIFVDDSYARNYVRVYDTGSQVTEKVSLESFLQRLRGECGVG